MGVWIDLEIARLRLSFTEGQIQQLGLGDVVSLNGVIFTCRTLFDVQPWNGRASLRLISVGSTLCARQGLS